MRKAINAVVIQDKKLLIVKKKDKWILPGGKPEGNESDLECLAREVDEELSGTKLKNHVSYGEFIGQTPNAGDQLKAIVYLADIDGELYGVRKGDSVSESAWVNDFSQYPLSDITQKIVDSLKETGYI